MLAGIVDMSTRMADGNKGARMLSFVATMNKKHFTSYHRNFILRYIHHINKYTVANNKCDIKIYLIKMSREQCMFNSVGLQFMNLLRLRSVPFRYILFAVMIHPAGKPQT